jgi:hypothetical protein
MATEDKPYWQRQRPPCQRVYFPCLDQDQHRPDGLWFRCGQVFLFVKQFSLVMAGHQVVPSTGFSGVIGICVVAVGAGATLVGYLRNAGSDF